MNALHRPQQDIADTNLCCTQREHGLGKILLTPTFVAGKENMALARYC
jgi:hypothetical protein